MLSLPVLVFDIETIPDVSSGSRLYDLDLAYDDSVMAMSAIRRQEVNSDFPRLPLHEIVCISGIWAENGAIKLFSFCQQSMSEKQILQRFLAIFDKHFPTLVSWNGTGFDLPVLMLRAMHHGLSAQGLLDQGEFDQQRRYSNYQNRYQQRHTDLMDCLALFNAKNFQRLDELALFLGFPGKQGQSGYHVHEYVKNKQWDILCQYCESDVLNTWLIYLRWQLLRGHLDLVQHQHWVQCTYTYIQENLPNQQDFLVEWLKNAKLTPFNPLI